MWFFCCLNYAGARCIFRIILTWCATLKSPPFIHTSINPPHPPRMLCVRGERCCLSESGSPSRTALSRQGRPRAGVNALCQQWQASEPRTINSERERYFLLVNAILNYYFFIRQQGKAHQRCFAQGEQGIVNGESAFVKKATERGRVFGGGGVRELKREVSVDVAATQQQLPKRWCIVIIWKPMISRLLVQRSQISQSQRSSEHSVGGGQKF